VSLWYSCAAPQGGCIVGCVIRGRNSNSALLRSVGQLEVYQALNLVGVVWVASGHALGARHTVDDGGVVSVHKSAYLRKRQTAHAHGFVQRKSWDSRKPKLRRPRDITVVYVENPAAFSNQLSLHK
jgi:hypothetical protein